MSECTEARFLKDVAEHQLTILRDDAHGRHIRLKRPNTGCYYFDLITWPGCLCYTGDMGTFVFTRIEDMFEFFRTGGGAPIFPRGNKELSINPSYWAEKLIAVDRNGGYEELDEEKIVRILKDDIKQWLRDHRYNTTREERRECWDAFELEVLHDDANETLRSAYGFQFYGFHSEKVFHFRDLFDHNFNRYTFHFLWACYAITWGIKQYDAARADQAHPAEVTP